MACPSPLLVRQHDYQHAVRPVPEAAAQRPGAARGYQADTPPLETVPYGPPEAHAGMAGAACEVVAGFGDLEREYAAVRRGAAILDSPHRAVLEVTGADRIDFLDRMLTQKLAGLDPGRAAAAFWLNRKGRILADLFVVGAEERVLLVLDLHAAATTVTSLNDFVFTEDVEVADVTGQRHVVAVHGPRAIGALAAAAETDVALEPGAAATLRIAGAPVVAARFEQTGETGLVLVMDAGHAEPVWEALIATDATVGESKNRVRPIGWHAFNIARIEAGTPLHLIDFGPESLPHETGVLDERVSFAKGCYPGQEIVARTHNLGHPKQVLVGLRVGGGRLPLAGAEVYAPPAGGETGPCVGVVTSSTLSPMLGQAPVAFAMVKHASAEHGTTLAVAAEGDLAEAVVGPLRFLPARQGREPLA